MLRLVSVGNNKVLDPRSEVDSVMVRAVQNSHIIEIMPAGIPRKLNVYFSEYALLLNPFIYFLKRSL